MEKRCFRCKEYKDINEFHHDRRSKDGHTGECKTCRSAVSKERYSNDEYRQGYLKKQRDKYANDAKLRTRKAEYVKQYRSDPDKLTRYKEYNRQYARTKAGKKIAKKSRLANIESSPHKYKAKTAVNNAIRRGLMPKVSSMKCIVCGQQARHYHHDSYEESNWLKVTPMCIKCHRHHHAS